MYNYFVTLYSYNLIIISNSLLDVVSTLKIKMLFTVKFYYNNYYKKVFIFYFLNTKKKKKLINKK